MRSTIVVLFLSLALPALADPPDARTIVERMKTALEPARSSTRKLTIVVSERGADSAQWVAGQARRRVGEANRMLTVMLAPDGVRGVAFLVEERDTEPGRQWVYLPSVRRVREIFPVESYHSFLNTDFTYADLGFVDRRQVHERTATETRDGIETYRVEAVPREQWYYSRIATWIATDSFLPVRREFHDPAGLLWKVQTWKQITEIDGVPIPLRIRMEDVRQSGSTELRVSEVLWNQPLPDELFEPGNLDKAASAAIWNP